MERPRYLKSPIGYAESLAKALSTSVGQLRHLSRSADSYYYVHDTWEKPDGSRRIIYGVKDPLKMVQSRIVERIYGNVHFPEFLQGSVKDVDNPRSYIAAASMHTNAVVLLNMDISNFFPSVTQQVVRRTWQRFFDFPPPVARLLARLTTHQGVLPQGAPTSPGLGNLVFWDCEGAVVGNIQELGFVYTRFVDDVVVSSQEFVEMAELNPIFAQVFGMFRSKGVRPNRNKIDISTSEHNMQVHNLNVNGEKPTIPKDERRRIRAAVRECVELAADAPESAEFEELWSSTYGRVNYLKELHPNEAAPYIVSLEKVRPSA